MADRPHSCSVRRAGARGAVGGNFQGLPAHPGAQHLYARRGAEEDARNSSRRLSAASRQAASSGSPPALSKSAEGVATETGWSGRHAALTHATTRSKEPINAPVLVIGPFSFSACP